MHADASQECLFALLPPTLMQAGRAVLCSSMLLVASACADDEASTAALDASTRDAGGADVAADAGGVDDASDAAGSADTAPDDTGADDTGADSAGDTAPDDAATDPVDPPPTLDLEPSDPPFALPDGSIAYRDVMYGTHEQNGFDVLLPPPAGEAAPLLVFIHGGGFTGGDKQTLYDRFETEIGAWLSDGIAVATINYRTLLPMDDEGVRKPLNDSRYCLQFLRYHADAFDIDPTRVAVFGSSAGAGTSLWLGTSDDMADPDATDPVERMSTRVSGVAIIGTQATYDLVRWETDVFVDFGITLPLIAAAAPELIPTLQGFYGLGEMSAAETLAALESPAIAAYRAEVDMLGLFDATDPPVHIQSGGPAARPSDIGSLYHHPNHGREVLEAATAVGVEAHAQLPNIDIETDGFPALGQFLADRVR